MPRKLVTTTLRPDMLIMSEARKLVVLVELTVPWEDRIDEAHELKGAKYSDLVESINLNGWHVHYFPVEVGSRGYPAKSLGFMFKSLGLSSRDSRSACRSAGDAAEESSRWIWLKRTEPWKCGYCLLVFSYYESCLYVSGDSG